MRKSISVTLLAIILLQSCAIYQITSVPISESINKGKVKMVKTNGDKVVLRGIEYENGTYWGLRQGYSKDHRYKIDHTQVSEVYIIDKYTSRSMSIVVAFGVIVAIPITVLLLWSNGVIN